MDLSIIHRVASRPEIFGLRDPKSVAGEEIPSQNQDGEPARARLRLKKLKEILHYEDTFGCFCRNFGKGIIVGAGGNIFAECLRVAVSLLGGRRLGGRNPLFTLLGRIHANREYTVRWGMFAAINLSIYNTWMYITRNYGDDLDSGELWTLLHSGEVTGRKRALCERVNHYRGAIGGALSGLSLLCLHTSTRPTLALFAVVRAFELLVKMMVRREIVPNIDCGDVLLMSVASAQLMHAFVFKPEILGESYRRFLERQVQYSVPIVQSIAQMARGVSIPPPVRSLLHDPDAYDEGPTYGTEILTAPYRWWPAAIAAYWLNGLKVALPVYVPVFTLPVLLFAPSEIIRAPLKSVTRILGGVMQSSVFLATYTSIGISAVIVCRRYLGLRYSVVGPRLAQLLGPIAGFCCGAAVLIDKPSRRGELALFVFGHSLNAMWNYVRGRLNRIVRFERTLASRYGDIFLFSFAFAIIMHAYRAYPAMIRRTYVSAMRRLFDSDTRNHFFRKSSGAPKKDDSRARA